MPFKSISVLQILFKVLLLGTTDWGQMFLYALKGPLSVAECSENAACSECFRKMESSRSFQMRTKSKELLQRFDGTKVQHSWLLLSGKGGNFSSENLFSATQIFSVVLHPNTKLEVRELNVFDWDSCDGKGGGTWAWEGCYLLGWGNAKPHSSKIRNSDIESDGMFPGLLT